MEMIEKIRYEKGTKHQREKNGDQKLQEKPTTIIERDSSVIEQTLQDKARRLWCSRKVIEWTGCSNIKNKWLYYKHEYYQ